MTTNASSAFQGLRKYDLSFDQVVQAVPINNFNVGGGSISSCNVDLACYGTSEVVVSTGHVIIPKVYLDVCYRCKGKTVRQKQEAFIYIGTL